MCLWIYEIERENVVPSAHGSPPYSARRVCNWPDRSAELKGCPTCGTKTSRHTQTALQLCYKFMDFRRFIFKIPVRICYYPITEKICHLYRTYAVTHWPRKITPPLPCLFVTQPSLFPSATLKKQVVNNTVCSMLYSLCSMMKHVNATLMFSTYKRIRLVRIKKKH
jgi:hypothetical protein